MKFLYRVFLAICLIQIVLNFDCGQKFLPLAFAEISSWKMETSPEIDAIIDKKNVRIADNDPVMETFTWQPVIETMTWRQTNGPNAGYIKALVMNPQGHIFAATYHSGVFRSIDNGQTWLHLGLGGQYIHDLVIDLKGNIFAGFSGGIYKSADNGDTWKRVLSNAIITHLYVIKHAIIAQDNVEGEVIYQSSDDGETWARSQLFDIEGSMMTALTTNSVGHLFMGTSRYFYWDSENTGGVYRSQDNGNTWTLTGLQEETSSILIDPGDNIFVATSQGIFYSNDHGGTWIRLNDNVVDSLEIDSRGNLFAKTFRNGIFRLVKNNTGWESLGLCDTYIEDFLITADEQLFVGTSNGVFRSTNDGNTWWSINEGLIATSITALAIHPDGDIFVGVVAGNSLGWGIFHSADKGGNWSYVGFKKSHVRDLIINSKGDIFVALRNKGLFRSQDKGATWDLISFSGKSILSLAVDVNDNIFAGVCTHSPIEGAENVMSLTPVGIFRSTDDGQTWMALSPITIDPWHLKLNVDGDVMVGDIHVSEEGEGYFSKDEGKTWMELEHKEALFSFSTVKNSLGEIFSLKKGRIVHSSDNGITWEDFNSGLENIQVKVLAVSKDDIFAGTADYGVFRRHLLPLGRAE